MCIVLLSAVKLCLRQALQHGRTCTVRFNLTVIDFTWMVAVITWCTVLNLAENK